MVTNLSTGKHLKIKVTEQKSVLGKTLGLMHSDKNVGILFETRFGIHSFFLKRPIDVLICSNKNEVISIKKNLYPNRLFFWNPKHNLVLELPKGSVKKLKVKKNDIINVDL